MSFDSLSFLIADPELSVERDILNDGRLSFVSERVAIIEGILSEGYDIYGGRLKRLLPIFMQNEARNVLINYRLYGCQQSLMKMHPIFDIAMAKVT